MYALGCGRAHKLSSQDSHRNFNCTLLEMVSVHLILNPHNAKKPITIPHLKYLNHLDLCMNNFEGVGIPKFIESTQSLWSMLLRYDPSKYCKPFKLVLP